MRYKICGTCRTSSILQLLKIEVKTKENFKKTFLSVQYHFPPYVFHRTGCQEVWNVSEREYLICRLNLAINQEIRKYELCTYFHISDIRFNSNKSLRPLAAQIKKEGNFLIV